MKINLNYQFKTLSGKELDKFIKDEKGNPTSEKAELNNMATLFANCMWLSSEKNMKFKLWAEELYKTGSLDIDEVDFELLIAWLEIYGTDQHKPYNTILAQVGIKGQIIDSMKKQKEKFNSKK